MNTAARCLHCRKEFTEEEIAGAACCPSCENPGTPADPAEDVVIRANWQELRILVMFAERWASTPAFADLPYSVRTVRAIAAEIQNQCPGMASRPLTFGAEVQQLREQFGAVEQNVVAEDAELSMPPKEDQ